MCSIDGFTGKNHPFSLKQYASFNSDRGPDGTNYWSDGQVHIAHSLLAISPNPTSLQQPIVDSKGNVFAWNGEIYGLPDGTFDTEWISNAIADEGIQHLKYDVDGMWAFVHYNTQTQIVTLARDHFGVKPLYYMRLKGELFWASTPKPLYAVLNAYGIGTRLFKKGMDIFDENDRFLMAPTTPFEFIKVVGPGQILSFDMKKSANMRPADSFWGTDVKKFNLFANHRWDKEEFQEIMKTSIREVCTAKGVRKCLSLSGGLDSTLIAGVNTHQDNFFTSSLRFEDRKAYWKSTNEKMFDESKIAYQTSRELGLEHHSVELSMDHNHLVQEAYYKLGAPMWDRARVVPRYANILNAKKHGAKIYITGDLADELLTGYSGDYYYYTENERRGWLDRQRWAEWTRTNNKFSSMQGYFPAVLMKDDAINNRQFLRIMQHGQGFCTTTDHLCGSQGIESRVPFLHQKLAKYLIKIPSGAKLRMPDDMKDPERDRMMGIYKWMIREEMSKWLPNSVEKRSTKAGFASPWNSRDKVLNVEIGKEDLKLVQSQANNFYKFDLDFQPNFRDNSIPFQYDMEQERIVELEPRGAIDEVTFDE
jgi:asparagine synthase (glutamine-hydrolysing)